MTEKHPLQTVLEEFAAQTGNFIVRSYSGRGMYGKECLAISGDHIQLIELGMEIQYREPEMRNSLRNLGYSSDSMGLGQVIYWPYIPYVGDNSSFEEEYEEREE